MVGDEASLPKSGFLTSPNWPRLYPNNHDSSQTIQVAEGKTIVMKWTDFRTEPDHDYVQVVDDNGANLTPRISGSRANPPVLSLSNRAHVKFHTDDSAQRKGWRLEWTESSVSSAAVPEQLGDCPESWTSLSTGCYHFITRPINWATAMTECHEMGGKLVEIEDSEENSVLSEEAPYWNYGLNGPIHSFWIGLGDFDEEGKWSWYSGRVRNGLPYEDRAQLTTRLVDPVDGYQAWGPDQPDGSRNIREEDCVFMKANRNNELSFGKWFDYDCSQNWFAGAICETLQ